MSTRTCNPAFAALLDAAETRLGCKILYERFAPADTPLVQYAHLAERTMHLCGPQRSYSPTSQRRVPYAGGVASVPVRRQVLNEGFVTTQAKSRYGDLEDFNIGNRRGVWCRMAIDLEDLFIEARPGIDPEVLWKEALELILVPAAAEATQDQTTALRKSMAAWYSGEVERQEADLRTSIRANEQEINRYGQSIATMARAVDDSRVKLVQLQAAGPAAGARAQEEVDALEQMKPEVLQSYRLQGNSLICVTQPVFLQLSTGTYALGRYTLAFSGNRVTITGETTKGGHQHPHVYNPTDPCFGNVSAGIYKLIGERHFAGAAAVIWQFLHTMRENGGYSATGWPRVKDELGRDLLPDGRLAPTEVAAVPAEAVPAAAPVAAPVVAPAPVVEEERYDDDDEEEDEDY